MLTHQHTLQSIHHATKYLGLILLCWNLSGFEIACVCIVYRILRTCDSIKCFNTTVAIHPESWLTFHGLQRFYVNFIELIPCICLCVCVVLVECKWMEKFHTCIHTPRVTLCDSHILFELEQWKKNPTLKIPFDLKIKLIFCRFCY